MLCWYVVGYEHIVPDAIWYTFSGLGKGIAGGCGTCRGMLVSVRVIPAYPGLGLKLGSRRGIATGFIGGEG